MLKAALNSFQKHEKNMQLIYKFSSQGMHVFDDTEAIRFVKMWLTSL